MSEPISVLVVDNHAVFRKALAKVLRQEGLDVIGLAPSGAAACDRLRTSRPDLVVSDLQMEPMNGEELIREIQARGWAVPVLIMSHREEGPVVRSALEAGAAGYVGKSQGGAAIAAACRQVVATGRYRPPFYEPD